MFDPEIRKDIQEWLFGAIEQSQNQSSRSQQVHIGPSEVGGCRELLRAKITGDITRLGKPTKGVKYAAFMGTAVGDWMEQAVAAYGDARTQVPISCTLPSGIEVHGSADIIRGNQVMDLKGKVGLDDIVQAGSSTRQYLIQISVYVVGAHQGGLVDDSATGHLVYYDRSGKDSQVWVDTVTLEQARGWLEVADERISDITTAIAAGTSGEYLRDEPEQRCWYFGCPMYDNCWTGYEPVDEPISDPTVIDAMRKYDHGRALQKTARNLMEAAKEDLGGFYPAEPVAGESDEFILKWTLRENRGVINRTIDLRRRKKTE